MIEGATAETAGCAPTTAPKGWNVPAVVFLRCHGTLKASSPPAQGCRPCLATACFARPREAEPAFRGRGVSRAATLGTGIIQEINPNGVVAFLFSDSQTLPLPRRTVRRFLKAPNGVASTHACRSVA